MRKTAGFLGGIVVITALAGGIAFAQQGDTANRLDRLFEQIDLDASSTITVQEMRAAAAARFNALDINGDGIVSAEERRHSRGNRVKIRFDRADRDGSGFLDADEITEVAKLRAQRRLARLDRDGDGMLSLDEVQQGRLRHLSEPDTRTSAMTLPQLDAQMMTMFRNADRDSDGVVTLQEAIAGAGR